MNKEIKCRCGCNRKSNRYVFGYTNACYLRMWKRGIRIKSYCLKCGVEILKSECSTHRPQRCSLCRDENKKEWFFKYSQERHAKEKFNLTYQEYEKIFSLCDEKCGICKKQLKLKKNYYEVVENIAYLDHNHETNKIRGILCAKCNFGIGQFKENIDTLKNAIKYIEKNKIESVEKKGE